MKQKLITLLTVFTLFCTMQVWASDTYTVGQDYQVIDAQVARAKGPVEVMEFFSYGCPVCSRFEPTLEKWLQNKPKSVHFTREPVVFHPQWEIYARAYYIAKALGVADKITPDLFAAIHQQHNLLTTQTEMAKFFAKHGVTVADFNDAYQYSMALDLQIDEAKKLLQQFRITGVPAIVVNRQYVVDMRMAQGDSDRMLAIVNYLIKKSANPSSA